MNQGVMRLSGEADPYIQTRLVAGWPIGTSEYRTVFDLLWLRSRTPPRLQRTDAWIRWADQHFSAVLEIPPSILGTAKPIIIPLRPRFPGSILNTAFWAALTFAAINLPRWLRRHHPGACPTCGYQVNDLPKCPECGTPTPAPIREEAPCSSA